MASLIEMAPKKVSLCKIGKIRAELSEEDQRGLDTLMEDTETYGDGNIAEALTKYGYPVSRYVVRPHRKGVCSCSRH